MTIPQIRDALEAAHVRWSMHRNSGDEIAAQQAWDDAENLGLLLFRAEDAQRYEAVQALLARNDFDEIRAHDHSVARHG